MTDVGNVDLHRVASEAEWQRRIVASRRRERALWTLPAVGVMLLVVYVSGPYRLCLRIARDVQDRNAQALSKDVDFERIRSAIKTRMTECFTRDEALKKNPFGGLAFALVNPMIDNLLTPENLIGMVAGSVKSSGATENPDLIKLVGAVKWEGISTVRIGEAVAESTWFAWRLTEIGEMPCPSK